jgi:hypothetical protein
MKIQTPGTKLDPRMSAKTNQKKELSKGMEREKKSWRSSVPKTNHSALQAVC